MSHFSIAEAAKNVRPRLPARRQIPNVPPPSIPFSLADLFGVRSQIVPAFRKPLPDRSKDPRGEVGPGAAQLFGLSPVKMLGLAAGLGVLALWPGAVKSKVARIGLVAAGLSLAWLGLRSRKQTVEESKPSAARGNRVLLEGVSILADSKIF